MDRAARTRYSNEPLWHLLYRFLWPFQYFRDVNRGSVMERQQNYRYNRSMRRFLPGFAVKWLLVALLGFAAGSACHAGVGLIIPAAGCYMSASIAFVVMLQVLVAWSWLAWFPERY